MPHLILENETFLIIAGQFYLYVFEKVSLSDNGGGNGSPTSSATEEKNEREKEKQFFVQLFYKLLPSIYYLSIYQSNDPYYNQLFKRQFSKLNLNVISTLLSRYNPLVQTYDADEESSSDDDDDDDDDEEGVHVSLVSEFDYEETELVNGSAIRQSVRSVQTPDTPLLNGNNGNGSGTTNSEKERNTRNFHTVTIKQPLKEFFDSIASNLPPSMSTTSLDSLGGDNNICSICYSYPADTEFVPCKHQSCRHCITLHLLSNDFCFYCRNHIDSTHLISDNNNINNNNNNEDNNNDENNNNDDIGKIEETEEIEEDYDDDVSV